MGRFGVRSVGTRVGWTVGEVGGPGLIGRRETNDLGRRHRRPQGRVTPVVTLPPDGPNPPAAAVALGTEAEDGVPGGGEERQSSDGLEGCHRRTSTTVGSEVDESMTTGDGRQPAVQSWSRETSCCPALSLHPVRSRSLGRREGRSQRPPTPPRTGSE